MHSENPRAGDEASPDRNAAEIAARQHGVLTSEQASLAGISEVAVRHRVASGRWARVHRGVYRIEGYPPSRVQSLMAACLLCGPGAAVSHRAAAALLGLRLPGDPPVEISVTRQRAPRTPGVIAHRSRDLDEHQLIEIDRLPVTGPVRLLVDLGQVVPQWQVDRALETFLSRKMVTLAQVRAGLAHHSRRGRNGCGTLRRILEKRGLGDLPPEGFTESLFAQICRDHGLPMPEHQHAVELAGRLRRIDFAYTEERIAVEVDGYEFHSGPEQFELDHARSNELTLAGWTLLRFTYLQVLHRPDVVAAQIRQVLRQRAA